MVFKINKSSKKHLKYSYRVNMFLNSAVLPRVVRRPVISQFKGKHSRKMSPLIAAPEFTVKS